MGSNSVVDLTCWGLARQILLNLTIPIPTPDVCLLVQNSADKSTTKPLLPSCTLYCTCRSIVYTELGPDRAK